METPDHLTNLTNSLFASEQTSADSRGKPDSIAASDPPTSAMGQGVIHVGISHAWHNKTLKQGVKQAWAWGKSFSPSEVTLSGFVDHVLNGGSWTPGYFDGNTRLGDKFLYSEVIALDADEGLSIAEALRRPLIAKHLLFAYSTPSCTPELYKTRFVFRLSEPVEGGERWRALVAALIRELRLKIDPASVKPAQPYHGSTNRVEQPYINFDAVLPVGLLGELTYDAALDEMLRATAPRLPMVQLSGVEAEDHSRRALERQLDRLRAAPQGERNDTLRKVSYTLFGYAKGGYAGIDEALVQRELESVVGGWENLRKSLATIKRAQKDAEPIKQEVPDRAKNGTDKKDAVRIVRRSSDQPDRVTDYAQEIKPPTLRQAGVYMVVCPEYALITQHITGEFTTAELAESIGCSLDKAQGLIKKAMRWQLVSERSAEKQRIVLEGKDTLFNSAERQLRGAAIARTYRLTPDLAEHEITQHLWEYVLELMEWGSPDVIRRDETINAGRTEDEAAQLEIITREVRQSIAADEVDADAERHAVRIADELLYLREIDDTSFTPDTPAASVPELRVQLVEALIATNPGANWRHGDLMWITGTRRGSVSAIISRSKYAPAESATYEPAPLEGNDPHRAVRRQCREKRGSPVAWLDANNNYLQGFSRDVPVGAAAVLLNLGKKYVPRAESASASNTNTEQDARRESETDDTQPEPMTEEQTAERAQHRAQREMMPRLRGCMRARGWKYVPGPFGYWARLGRRQKQEETCSNTWAAMVEALLADYEWADDQRAARLLSDPLVLVGIELGAQVTPL